MRIWFFCPVYHDVEPLQLLLENIRSVMGGESDAYVLRFIAIDDSGRHDPDIDLLSAHDDVTVVSCPFNLGHQRAIVFGLRTLLPSISDDDVIVTMDADGEDRPEDLPRLLARVLDADPGVGRLVVARRTKRHTSLRYKLMYFFFTILFRLLTGTTVRSGNFAAYRGWLAHRILRHPNFDLCYSSTLLSLGLPIVYVPCPRGPRYSGQSRMGFSKLFMHGLRMMMPFTDRIAVRALVLFSVTLTISVALALVIVGIRLFTETAIPGWATYALLGTVILSFVALGNFITLFAVVSQSLSISLADLDRVPDGPPREPTAPPG
jgi:polyisoprenyl-phosphate glycosyltransferase